MVEPAGKPFRLLIVEDSLVFQTFLRARLQAQFPAAEILAGGGVEEGYRIAMEKEPDVVFIDVGLPDGNGLDLATRLRGELPAAALAVCTMHEIPEYRREALRRGARAFFGKQRMDWPGVESFVRDAVSRRAARAEPGGVLAAAPEAAEGLADHGARPPPLNGK